MSCGGQKEVSIGVRLNCSHELLIIEDDINASVSFSSTINEGSSGGSHCSLTNWCNRPFPL